MRLLRRTGLLLAAPALAVVFALLITSLVLLATGTDPWSVYSAMLDYAGRPRTQTLILNSATTYYFAAIAVAVGFRMNLFNIGVDGQYRLAAMLAASLGGYLVLPGPLSILMIIVTAMLVGALWAGIAGVLKVYRGVSEVISTIMLNFVATGIVAYLLSPGRLAVRTAGSNNIGTKPIAESAHVPGLGLVPDSTLDVYGLVFLAVAVGIGFWFVINRTRFGFDLRATGISEPAAVASGVNVRRMIVVSMLLSGGVAGLVGMPQLLGSSYTYSLDFPAGLGFTGIAIALVGRNSPVGVAVAALLFAYLDVASNPLQIIANVAPEVVKIMQGIIVLSVVIAYEMVRRYSLVAEQRKVARQLQEVPA
jgi:ABC-type uncharacterized transport system permease subunit